MDRLPEDEVKRTMAGTSASPAISAADDDPDSQSEMGAVPSLLVILAVRVFRLSGPNRLAVNRLYRCIASAAVLLPAAPALPQEPPQPTPVIDGITFSGSDTRVYLPAREAADALGWMVEWDGKAGRLTVNHAVIPPDMLETLVDGTRLIYIRGLETAGAKIEWLPSERAASVAAGDRAVKARAGPKRVEIDRKAQTLRAWQGERLVLDTQVSTGRQGHSTPAGEFRAGPLKLRMHYSTLFNNAPMPWSVQVIGNVFIHGFTSVPDYPASHGCIRLPLSGSNPAHWFFRWVDVGIPIRIS